MNTTQISTLELLQVAPHFSKRTGKMLEIYSSGHELEPEPTPNIPEWMELTKDEIEQMQREYEEQEYEYDPEPEIPDWLK